MAGLLRRAAGKLGMRLQSIAGLEGLENLVPAGTSGRMAKTPLSDAQAREHYRGWQYAAANLIAETVMRTEWAIKDEDGEPIKEHPAERLFRRANPIISGRMLFFMTTLDLVMVGKSHWYSPSNGLGEPAELWPLAGVMEPKIDEAEGRITSWTQRLGAKVRTYQPEEVVWLRWPKPGDLWGSFGGYHALSSELRMDAQITESEWDAMRQGVWPSVILKMPSNVYDSEQRKGIRDEFEDRYAAARGGSGKVVGMSDSMSVDWPPTKPREMGYSQAKRETDERILGVLRTPPALLGVVTDVNRATAEALNAIFAQWTVEPKLMMLADQINEQVVHPTWGEDVNLEFADPVPPDKEYMAAQEERDLRHGVRTVNEVRGKRGLEDVPWGDRPLMPIGVAPMAAPKPTASRMAKQALSREDRRAIALAFAEQSAGLRRRYRQVALDWFDWVEDGVLLAWDEAAAEEQALRRMRLPSRVDRWFSIELARELAERSAPLNREGLVIGGEFQRAQTIAAPYPLEWAEDFAAIDRYAAEWGATHFEGVVDRTRERLTETVAEGVRQNETMAELRARIVEDFGAMRESRATAIATTETTKLWGSAGHAFREHNKVPRKVWITSFVNSRETHKDADGQVVGQDDYFHVGGDRMMFPGDGALAEENVNCNCAACGTFEEN